LALFWLNLFQFIRHLSDISDNVTLVVIGNLSAKTQVYRQFVGKNKRLTAIF